jgi:protein-tyrosine phosphatase
MSRIEVQVGARDHAGIVDIHNHLMPGVDDGAQDLAESRAALASLRDSGVRLIITTPHLLGSLTQRGEQLAERLAELDAAWAELHALAASEFPELQIGRGTEIMLDVPNIDLSDERVRMAGGSFVLVEFPHMTVPPQSVNAISALRMQGWRPVLAHPERYFGMQLELAAEWRRVGAHLQVNGRSLLGSYGEDARHVALELLARGWVDYLASDYHARGRIGISSVRSWLEERGGDEQAHILMEANPGRLAQGEAPIGVPPLRAKKHLWARLTAVFR